MKIRALIVEDELLARQTLKSYLTKYFSSIEILAEIGTVREAIDFLNHTGPDVVFLDVQLKDGMGTQILQHVSFKNIRIVFTTAHDNFTKEAFNIKAFGYLLKPLDPLDFKEIMNRVVKDVIYSNPTEKSIKVPSGDGFTFIETSTVIRCEAESNYTKLICSGNRTYMLAKTLKKVEEIMRDEEHFIRVHQSHLVNINFIDRGYFKSHALRLKSGEEIPVSRARKQDLLLLLKRTKG